MLVGIYIAGGNLGVGLVPALAAFSAAAGGYVFNDLFDVKIDRIVKPWRPLPSGFNPKTAWFLCITLWSAGLVFALLQGLVLTIFYCLWVALLTSYTLVMKGMGLVGHFISSSVSSSGLLLGGFLIGQPSKTVFAFLLAFFLHMMREVVKCIADHRGDSRFRVGTVAVRWGVVRAVWLAILLGILLMCLSIVPFATGQFGIIYLSVVVGGIYPILIVTMMRLWLSRDLIDIEKQAIVASTLLKLAMPIGLVAFITGRLI
ncbi:MAG: UbiA family prenyltransferase [bacterium]